MPTATEPHLSIDLICLDAGGVLLFPNWERVSTLLARHGIATTAEQLAAADHRAKHQLDQAEVLGTTNNAGHGWLYLQAVLEAAGVSSLHVTPDIIADLRAAHAERNLWEIPGSDAPDALAQVRQLGPRLAVVSNSDGRLRQLLETTDLARWFDLIVDSHDVGFEKPDPRLFQFVVAQLGVEPVRALHVGDLYHVDVVGARAAGLHAALLDPASLYLDIDCPRIASLLELPNILAGS